MGLTCALYSVMRPLASTRCLTRRRSVTLRDALRATLYLHPQDVDGVNMTSSRELLQQEGRDVIRAGHLPGVGATQEFRHCGFAEL
ncbi:hypothetical protein E2C01_014821 [Portunus trituberculatus]|uniref:Uncharacterized protein n=1 Tax=Portunus trituberculatus TaxID=210409 RepID=A0A5B7DJR4_PORTR|nr:hypothetical protein [Portunus trituberculatus]